MIEITDHPIDVGDVLTRLEDPACGGQVLFVGTTRQLTQLEGRQVETDHLLYEAYDQLASAEMTRLEAEARQRWPVRQVVLVHRTGRVDPMEASVVVGVASPHRAEAFEAARWLIDELKHRVPIWKQEHYVQSGAQWIHPTGGSCRCHRSAADLPSRPDPVEGGEVRPESLQRPETSPVAGPAVQEPDR